MDVLDNIVVAAVQWPAKLAGLSAAVGTVAAVAAAVTGIRTLRRARTDSKNRNRPMVAAELRDDEHAEGVQLLVIRNYGPTVARHLRVTFAPPIPPDSELPSETVGHLLRVRYEREISVLTPGMELDNIWYVADPYNRDGTGGSVNAEGLADQFAVRLDYIGPDGEKWSDQFQLDVDVIRKRTYVTSSNDPREQLKKLVSAVETLAQKT